MAGLLSNFRNTMIVSVVLALIIVFAYSTGPHGADGVFWQGVFRWLHVFFGILWIGLLYYFNFVQIRVMPAIPAELKPAVSKYIAPEALFWFRWAALLTVIMGLGLAGAFGLQYQRSSIEADAHARSPSTWRARTANVHEEEIASSIFASRVASPRARACSLRCSAAAV